MNIEETKNGLLSSHAGSHWRKIRIRRRAGVLFPLFSLRTKNNMGIGEFPDLKLLVDWCLLTGNTIIQLLPVNDTGSRNFPYSALSAFAINPIFLSPFMMDGNNPDIIRIIPELSEKPRRRDRVDYASVYKIKMRIFESLFNEFERSGTTALREEFYRYRERNREWLDDYSLYITIKENHKGVSWERWPKKYRERDEAAIRQFREKHNYRFCFYCYLQWQVEKQFSEIYQYAAGHGVLIKGDIPFLVGRDSVDVWAYRSFFNIDTSAGAPPDMFSKTGQKWGFPTFNWEAMKIDGYSWYKRRLKQAEKFYNLYRIDHAIGLYRIYCIEKSRPNGSIGWFDPPDESEWERHGETLIKMMLDSSHMLPIAEDLGMVPNCVRPNLRKLGVPRTLVDRWERNYAADSSFLDLTKVDPVSMNTMSTHDTETIRQWWENNPGERNDFYHDFCYDGAPPEKLTPDVHQRILERNYASNSLFTINLPQDLFRSGIFSSKPEKHRINIPARVSRQNWSYLFPIMLEELINPTESTIEEENIRIRELVEKSGRI